MASEIPPDKAIDDPQCSVVKMKVNTCPDRPWWYQEEVPAAETPPAASVDAGPTILPIDLPNFDILETDPWYCDADIPTQEQYRRYRGTGGVQPTAGKSSHFRRFHPTMIRTITAGSKINTSTGKFRVIASDVGRRPAKSAIVCLIGSMLWNNRRRRLYASKDWQLAAPISIHCSRMPWTRMDARIFSVSWKSIPNACVLCGQTRLMRAQ